MELGRKMVPLFNASLGRSKRRNEGSYCYICKEAIFLIPPLHRTAVGDGLATCILSSIG